MKQTLLEIVQDILNDLDSDEVNSIDETVEAQQISMIVKRCFIEMTSNRNWPHQRTLAQFDSLIDMNRPNYLKIPENIKEVVTFKYDKRKEIEGKMFFQDVKYKTPDEFLHIVSQRNSDNDNVIVVYDFSGAQLLILNDAAPTYWTSFDDTHIITDSYDKTVDDTLQSSKTQCVVYEVSKWVHQDDAIPNLPAEAFSALIEEAKSTAFLVLKQMNNPKAEQKAGRQQRWLARKAWRANGGVKYENYGRKGRR